MSDDVHLGKVLDFLRLLWAVDHGLQSISKRMTNELGITGLQRMTVRIIGRFPKISAGRLAEILHVHPSTLTGVLSRLLRRKAIARSPDPDDARRALFVLTAKGRELDQLQSGTVEAAVRRALANLSDKQLDAAREVLEVLIKELEAEERR